MEIEILMSSKDPILNNRGGQLRVDPIKEVLGFEALLFVVRLRKCRANRLN